MSNDEQESLNLRIPADLKKEVVAYAKQLGVSRNAAGILLLNAGLKAKRDG